MREDPRRNASNQDLVKNQLTGMCDTIKRLEEGVCECVFDHPSKLPGM